MNGHGTRRIPAAPLPPDRYFLEIFPICHLSMMRSQGLFGLDPGPASGAALS